MADNNKRVQICSCLFIFFHFLSQQRNSREIKVVILPPPILFYYEAGCHPFKSASVPSILVQQPAARHHKGLKCVRCRELPAVMKCSSTGRVSSPLVSRAVFLNYWRSRQFHPTCQRLAILLRILPRNRHEIFTSLYRHPGVGVITRQRGSVYHGGRSNLGSLFRNQAASIMHGSPHFVSRI